MAFHGCCLRIWTELRGFSVEERRDLKMYDLDPSCAIVADTRWSSMMYTRSGRIVGTQAHRVAMEHSNPDQMAKSTSCPIYTIRFNKIRGMKFCVHVGSIKENSSSFGNRMILIIHTLTPTLVSRHVLCMWGKPILPAAEQKDGYQLNSLPHAHFQSP